MTALVALRELAEWCDVKITMVELAGITNANERQQEWLYHHYDGQLSALRMCAAEIAERISAIESENP